MKKLIVLLVIIVFVALLLLNNLLTVKPLMINDISKATTSITNPSNIKINLYKGEKNIVSIGEINKLYADDMFKDNNNFIEKNHFPVILTVSNQDGEISEQILTIYFEKYKKIDVFIPKISGTGGLYYFFYVDNKGSTYYACPNKGACDGEILNYKQALKKDNIARKKR